MRRPLGIGSSIGMVHVHDRMIVKRWPSGGGMDARFSFENRWLQDVFQYRSACSQ